MPVENKAKQPKQLMTHPRGWGDFISQQMGIWNNFQGFDHFFLLAEAFHKHLLQVEAKEIVTPIDYSKMSQQQQNEIKFNPEAIRRIKQIWYGPTFISIKRNPFNSAKVLDRKFCYERPKEAMGIAIRKLPALKNMNPIGTIRLSDLCIRIREMVPVADAFEGMNPNQLNIAGGFNLKFKNKIVPMFKTMEDMRKPNAYTYWVGRNYFNETVSNLQYHWLTYYSINFVALHHKMEYYQIGTYNTTHNNDDDSTDKEMETD